MNKSLGLIDIFRAAISHLWVERKIIGGLLAIVVSIDVALEWLQPSFADENEETGWSVFVFVLTIQALVYTLFAVRVHRLILGVANPVQGVFRWKSRETRFFAWLLASVLLLLIVGFLVVSVVLGAVAVVVPYDLSDSLVAILSALAFLPAAYLLARLIVLLPAIAIDRKQNITWAWVLTKGNGWRLMLILWGLPAILASVLSASASDFWIDNPIGSIVLNLILGLATALEVSLLSVAFKMLMGEVLVQAVADRIEQE